MDLAQRIDSDLIADTQVALAVADVEQVERFERGAVKRLETGVADRAGQLVASACIEMLRANPDVFEAVLGLLEQRREQAGIGLPLRHAVVDVGLAHAAVSTLRTL